RRNNIHIAAASFHALLILNTAQQRDLVTNFGGALEIQRHRGGFHAAGKLFSQRIAAAFEKHHRMAYVLGIFLRIHQPHTWRLAALDLILQAGPGAVAVETVFTLTNKERLLQKTQALADRPCTWVWAEVAPQLFFCPAMDAQTREITAGKKYVGVGLIVTQQNVVRRPPLLDQRLLQQQRLGLVSRDGDFDLSDARYQRRCLRRLPGLAEVARQAFLEVLRLAHVEQLGLGIEHPVDTGTHAT